MFTGKSPRWFAAILSIAMCASATTGCALSTGPRISPAGEVPRRLLVRPTDPPAVDRTTDPATGKQSVNGEQALTWGTSLLDWGGGLAKQLNDLIDAVLANEAKPEKKGK